LTLTSNVRASDSQNTVDSQGWTYNKDPHAGIFAIRRFNIADNATEYVTGGPGGVRRHRYQHSLWLLTRLCVYVNERQAARPILSKDGKTLAFVRRIYGNTSLVLHDLETGTLRKPTNRHPDRSRWPCGRS
jgi:hypothetical protein